MNYCEKTTVLYFLKHLKENAWIQNIKFMHCYMVDAAI